jgi:hypothetical protein
LLAALGAVDGSVFGDVIDGEVRQKVTAAWACHFGLGLYASNFRHSDSGSIHCGPQFSLPQDM